MFKWVHPEVGDNFKCATGEPYVVYAIACRDADLAMTKLINTFRILSTGGAALVKPDGEPVMLDDDSPRYLYWRRLPEITLLEETNYYTAISGRWYAASARACISKLMSHRSQLTKNQPWPDTPYPAEDKR